MSHVSLQEQLREHGEFAQWADEVSATPNQPEQTEMPVTLRALLGGVGEPIERKGLVFYPESPTLLELDDLLETMQSGDAKPFARAVKALTYILQVTDGDKRRRATFEEIGTAFSSTDRGLVLQLIRHYSGLSQTGDAEGNA